MKSLLQTVLLAGILSGCAAIDTSPFRTSAPSTQKAPGNGGVDAVTRTPVQTETSATAEAPAGPPVEIETVPAPVELDGGPQIPDPEIDPATARSYQASWEDGGYLNRSVMFPHIIDGCKVLVQSRRTLDYVGGSEGEFVEREGLDCNCDLLIDGFEDIFAQLNDSYKTPRMYSVCVGPGVDGATRQLEIMRESLKEQRNFDKMKNVEGF